MRIPLIFHYLLTPILALIYSKPEHGEPRKDILQFIIDEMDRQTKLDNSFNYKDLAPSEIAPEYDFIVIGSGSSGSVIANRLSEVPEWRILLVEVGVEPTGYVDIPQLAPAFQFTELNWRYSMEKQDGVALGMVDQRMPWPRGRGLGGTTNINYMLAVRGNREDYNKWERMGNPGWSYRDVFRYFVKSEDSTVAVNDTGYRFPGGPQDIQDVPYRTQAVKAWVNACQEAGYPYVDYNGKQQFGTSFVQGTLRKGRRCSVEKAYLRPVRSRPNLTILTGAAATEILIDPSTKTAYGIKYTKNGVSSTVRATKEVISSAGAFHSPQLLMLSGVGPEEHLAELGIPVIQNLPVGQKLYDHICFIGLIFTVNETINERQEELTSVPQFLNFFLRGNGTLTGLGGVEAFTYIKTKESREPKRKYPDIELIFIGAGLHTDLGVLYRKTFGVTDEIYDAVWKPLEDKQAFMVLPMLMHPKSHGFLKLRSKSPHDPPKFYGNFFTDPEGHDIRTFIAAIREAQRIAKSPSMRRYDAKIHDVPIPGCQNRKFNTDAYWECALRHLSPTLHHQVATCKMGPREDPEAVVDHRLRVHGIKNLRVADTSVIPLPLTAHTNIPAQMVGEKCADMIKQDHLVRGREIYDGIYPPDEEDEE